MYQVMFRFKCVKNNEIFEVVFDSRLSFRQNFNLLNKILRIDNVLVYDPYKAIFLNIDVPISIFNINSFMMFYLF